MNRHSATKLIGPALCALVAGQFLFGATAPQFASGTWPFYGGDQGGSKYSSLDEINRNTVQHLRVAWEWSTGEKAMPEFKTRPGMFEVTPVMVDGTLYLSTPYNRV